MSLLDPEPPATDAAPETRRQRTRRLTRERILAAASELFSEHGFDEVTTQQIAARADVSNGTFFRHVGTKADLLVALMTQRVRQGRETGLALARAGAPTEDAVIALLTPMAELTLDHPELGLAYQRELLFPAREDRAAALDEVEDLQRTIGEILAAGAGAGRAADDVALVALAIYSTAYIELVRFAVGRVGRTEVRDRLARTIGTLTERLLPDT